MISLLDLVRVLADHEQRRVAVTLRPILEQRELVQGTSDRGLLTISERCALIKLSMRREPVSFGIALCGTQATTRANVSQRSSPRPAPSLLQTILRLDHSAEGLGQELLVRHPHVALSCL